MTPQSNTAPHNGISTGAAGAEQGAPAGSPAIRLFRGRSITELIPKIQSELGGDAIVVGRRSGLEGGIAGFFQRPFVELEARPGGTVIDIRDGERALPDPGADAQQDAAEGRRGPAAAQIDAAPREQSAEAEPLAERRNGHDEGPLPFEAALAAVQSALEIESDLPAPSTGWSGAITVSAPERPSAEPAQETPQAPLGAPQRASAVSQTVSPGGPARAAQKLVAELCASGIGDQLARDLVARTQAHALALAPRTSLRRALRSTLARSIPELSLPTAAGALIVVVGPGGAGKTTLLRALHERYDEAGLLQVTRAAIAPAGRDGALQLDRGEIGTLALSARQAQKALGRARTGALALVDTPPLSASNRAQTRELAAFLAALAPERVIVVLPATLSLTSASQLLKAIAPLKANAMAITHADETDQLGVAIEVACRFELAPELLLGGRSGGASLQSIDARTLSERLLP